MWDEVKNGLLKCPRTYLPALFNLLVERCIQENIFKPGGIRRIVESIEALHGPDTSQPTYPEQATFIGFVWGCPTCGESKPKNRVSSVKGVWTCNLCGKPIRAMSIYREHFERATITPALIQCAKVLRQWHGGECFDIYYQNSPEMKAVREELSYEEFIKAGGSK